MLTNCSDQCVSIFIFLFPYFPSINTYPGNAFCLICVYSGKLPPIFSHWLPQLFIFFFIFQKTITMDTDYMGFHLGSKLQYALKSSLWELRDKRKQGPYRRCMPLCLNCHFSTVVTIIETELYKSVLWLS